MVDTLLCRAPGEGPAPERRQSSSLLRGVEDPPKTPSPPLPSSVRVSRTGTLVGLGTDVDENVRASGSRPTTLESQSQHREAPFETASSSVSLMSVSSK